MGIKKCIATNTPKNCTLTDTTNICESEVSFETEVSQPRVWPVNPLGYVCSLHIECRDTLLRTIEQYLFHAVEQKHFKPPCCRHYYVSFKPRPWKSIQSVTSHAFEATATRPDKCHLDIKRAVTHPRVNKAEPCLTKATTNLTSYHSAARLVKSSVEELN